MKGKRVEGKLLILILPVRSVSPCWIFKCTNAAETPSHFSTSKPISYPRFSISFPLPRKVFLVCFADPGRIIQHLFPRPCFCLCTSRASLLRSYILTFELHRQFIALTPSSSSWYLPFRNVPQYANIALCIFVPRYYPFLVVHFINISSQFAQHSSEINVQHLI